jgi:hypothetical protein
LWYFDFERAAFRKEEAEFLFAEVGANTRRTEDLLSQLIESPIGAAVHRLARPASAGLLELRKWELVRALLLLFPTQGLRPAEAPGHHLLATLLDSPKPEIDHALRQIMSTRKMVRVRASSAMPMFYPESGFFVLPDVRPNGTSVGRMVIPLTSEFAVALVDSDSDLVVLRDLWRPGYVANRSVGIRSNRVVVHPDAMQAMDIDFLESTMRDLRSSAEEEVQLCSNLNEIVVHLDASIGTA